MTTTRPKPGFLSPPQSFYDALIRDVPASKWVSFFRDYPKLKERVFSGFSKRQDKLPRLMRQPQVEVRFRRLLQNDDSVLESVLLLWGEVQLPMVAFVEMLEASFVLEYWHSLKNLIGPERFFACLWLLDYLSKEDFSERLDEGFWGREVTEEVTEPLIPMWTVWRELQESYPEVQNWLDRSIKIHSSQGGKERVDANHKDLQQDLRREQERRAKVEQKLSAAHNEIYKLKAEIEQLKTVNERLKQDFHKNQQNLQRRIEQELARQRRDWFRQYHEAGIVEGEFLESTRNRLGQLLKRAEEAFRKQQQADRQYGLISEIGTQLLHVDLYLQEIERIYGESVVVHSDVAKVAKALREERERLLRNPGIKRVFDRYPQLQPESDWRRQIRLLDPVPENLGKLAKAEEITDKLESLDLFSGLDAIKTEIDHKKRQIQETLYQRFQLNGAPATTDRIRNLDDLVQTGLGRRFCVYVDGYNVLLKVWGLANDLKADSLTQLRESFIEAVVRKSRLFKKIYLVFDGHESSRERQGNVEIIYSDKTRGVNADALIIQDLRKRKNKNNLLVTADQEIIKKTEKQVYALIDPLHFYSLIYNLERLFG